MSNLQQQVEERRTIIAALNSKLGAGDAPANKERLTHALGLLDTVKTAFKGDTSNPSWIKLATFNLQRAIELHNEVLQAIGNRDPEKVEERPSR